MKNTIRAIQTKKASIPAFNGGVDASLTGLAAQCEEISAAERRLYRTKPLAFMPVRGGFL